MVGFRVIAVLLLQVRNERKEGFTAGIALARLGPILVKYLQSRLAISTGSVMVLPSDLNDDGRGDLLFRLFITSCNNFQVNLRSFLHFQTFCRNMNAWQYESDGYSYASGLLDSKRNSFALAMI